MLHSKEYYESKAATLLTEIRDMERYIYDQNFGGEQLHNQVKVRANLLLADMRKHHISLLELISLIWPIART